MIQVQPMHSLVKQINLKINIKFLIKWEMKIYKIKNNQNKGIVIYLTHYISKLTMNN